MYNPVISLATMRNLTLILSLLLLSVAGVAQQQTQSSFNYLNGYNLNKSFAGKDTCSRIFFQHKNQWVGVDDAPSNTSLQAHTQLPKQFGIGIGINRWAAGLLSQFDASVAVAKHITIKNKVIVSPSINLGYARYSLNADDAIAFDSDTYLNQNRTSSNSFYADLGLLVRYDNLEAGVSIPKLITSDPEFDVADVDPTLSVENYFKAHAAYDFEVKDVWNIKPMLIYRTIPQNGQMLDIMAEAKYNNKIGVALGYRTNSGLLASANYEIKDMFTIGYAYDVGGQRLAGIGSGSHEVLVGFKLCRSPKESAPKEELHYFLSGQLSDEANGNNIANAQVTLKDATTGMDTTIATDSAGNYRFEVAPGRTYNLAVNHPDYVMNESAITSDSVLQENANNIELEHKHVTLNGVISDLAAGTPLEQVQIALPDGSTNQTDESGAFDYVASEAGVAEQQEQQIRLVKEGYHDTTVIITLVPANYDDINLQIAMRKIAEPEDAPVIVDNKIVVNPIYFEVGSSSITAESLAELDRIVEVMNANPEMRVEVNAHTDCTGSATGNQRLSDARAKACVTYISEKISDAARITGKGFGETQPLTECTCPDCSAEDHAKNRRTEFVIIN